jgi:uncharacterized protein (DUF1800 family)
MRPVHWLHASAMVLLYAGFVSYSDAATSTAVEFYHPTLKHYFVAARPAEIAVVDGGGAGPGWVRTGQSFDVWLTQADAPSGASPVCRFYGTPGTGPNSHFFTADPGECEFVKQDPGWTYEGIEFYAVRVNAGACGAGLRPVYRNYNNRASANDSNHRYSTTLAIFQDMADQGWTAEGAVLCVPGVSTAQKSDIYRLLRQATFGPTDALVTRVEQLGMAGWIEEQFNAPKSAYPELPYVPFNAPDNCIPMGRPANDPAVICARDNYTLFQVQNRFLQNALAGEDQLRQRVAFALSQILVTSGTEVSHAYGMTRYQQLMLDHAFGNYRDLLTAMTLSPAMGRYLDMANSNKPDPNRGISANENFARENLQLFTIGLYELNQDGTFKRTPQGALIPTYTQTTVENFARVFTGWTYPSVNGSPALRNNPVNYSSPMVAVESNHDTGPKTLLNGVALPAGQSALKDLNDAIDNLFNHANTAPFISRQLIQKLVGGSPSPAYVGRVAAVFNNNGSGVRGDLRAVTRAILLDGEARGDVKMASNYGHLLEPVLLVTGMVRGLNGRSDGVAIRGQLGGMGQNIFTSPSVFNFYPPDKALPSTGSTAPEFAILNSSTVFNRANFINTLVMGNAIAPDPTVAGAFGTSLDWSAFQALAGDPAGLVDKLAWTFTAGSLSDSARRIIVAAVNAVSGDSLARAQTAAYLVLNASQTQVER